MTLRNSYIDNLKGFLIIMIVLDHFIADYTKLSPYINLIYIFMYTFHIPLFVFISGYLSKNSEKQRDKALIDFLGLYLFTSMGYTFFSDSIYTIYSLESINLTKIYNIIKDTIFSGLLAKGPSWYLLSLIFWRMITPYFKNKRILIISILLALIAGGIPQIGPAMSLSRTIVFYPFFLFGYLFDENIFIRFTENVNYWIKPAAVICVFFILIILNLKPVSYQMLYSYSSYLDNGYTLLAGIMIRAYIFILAAINSFCFLCLIPKKKSIITAFGKKSLYIYIGHTFLIPIVGILNNILGIYAWSLILIIIISLFACYLFSRKCFENFISKIKNAFNRFLFSKIINKQEEIQRI